MAAYLSTKMKRKDLEEVYDDFSEFSLSSPARKIRRLDAELPPIMEDEEYEIFSDAELPPIMEEEEHEIFSDAELPPIMEEEEHEVPLIYEQPLPTEQLTSSMEQVGASFIEALNEERALVLYKPVNNPLLQSSSSSNYYITVNSDLIPGFKNFWPNYPNSVKKVVDDDVAYSEQNSRQTPNNNLAVVPWVPSFQFPLTSSATDDVQATGISEPMEAEETETATMEIEEDNIGIPQGPTMEPSALQWQQQHCTTPQLPENRLTPITWYR